MSFDRFRELALPLHINITHTPPVIGGEKDDRQDVAQTDPGFIGAAALIPGTLRTGSYGWEGCKRATIELSNHVTGEKEEVEVMLSYVSSHGPYSHGPD